MRGRCCVVLLLIATLMPGTVSYARDVTVGIEGGINVANFTGNDVYNNSSNTGLIAGVFARFAWSDYWSLQPEVLYSQRGATYTDAVTTEQQTDYIEVPLLVRFAWGSDSFFHPALFVGPAVGFLLRNRIVDGEEIDLKDHSRNVDVGVVIGAGLDYELGSGVILLDARWELGLISWNQDLNAKNNTLSFMAGYGFPLHRQEPGNLR
ncbi:MAG TPA: porin family protein [Candidatus Krumholzibacteria bacterium]|nr:porin family protein [Candidatus Krumholzibacteria bacterium]